MKLPHDSLSKNKRQVIEQMKNKKYIIITQAVNGGAAAILYTNDLKEAKG